MATLINVLFKAITAFFAFQRFRQGADAAFATNYESDANLPTSYPSYPGGPESDQQYQEPPFSAGPNQRGKRFLSDCMKILLTIKFQKVSRARIPILRYLQERQGLFNLLHYSSMSPNVCWKELFTVKTFFI